MQKQPGNAGPLVLNMNVEGVSAQRQGDTGKSARGWNHAQPSTVFQNGIKKIQNMRSVYHGRSSYRIPGRRYLESRAAVRASSLHAFVARTSSLHAFVARASSLHAFVVRASSLQPL